MKKREVGDVAWALYSERVQLQMQLERRQPEDAAADLRAQLSDTEDRLEAEGETIFRPAPPQPPD